MKKNIILFTAGLAASVMLMNGCASQASASSQTTGAEVQTEAEAPEEEQTEAEEKQTEMEEKQTEAEEKQIEAADEMRIWGTVLEAEDGRITVDNESQVSSQGEIILNISPESTYVLDGENGYPVDLEQVEPGYFEAYLGPVMSASLPPQNTPEMVIVNVPEGAAAPRYITADGAVEEKDGISVLKAVEGTEYPITADAQVLPYLTKNIVGLNDIEEGSRCLVWMNEEGSVEKLVLFAE